MSRGDRLRRNVLAGFLGRGGAALAALATVPIILGALGPERYGVYVGISAIAAWAQLGTMGLGKGLVNALVACYASGDQDLARRQVASLWGGALALLAAIAAATFAIFPLVDWAAVFGASEASFSGEVRATFAVSLATSAGLLALSPTENVFAAYQEERKNSLWAFLRSLANLGGAAAAGWLGLGMAGFALLTGLASVAVSAAATAWLFGRQQPALRPRPGDFSPALLRRAASGSLWFLAVDASAMVVFHLDRFLVLRFAGGREAAGFDLAMRLFTLAFGLFHVVLGPLWPAMGEALRRRDTAWVRAAVARVSGFGMAAMAALAVVFILFGDAIVAIWTRSDVGPGPWVFGLIGIYFVMRAWADVHSVTLFSLERQGTLARSALLHAAVSLVLGLALGSIWGALGVAAANALAFAGIAIWWIPLQVRRGLEETAS